MNITPQQPSLLNLYPSRSEYTSLQSLFSIQPLMLGPNAAEM